MLRQCLALLRHKFVTVTQITLLKSRFCKDRAGSRPREPGPNLGPHPPNPLRGWGRYFHNRLWRSVGAERICDQRPNQIQRTITPHRLSLDIVEWLTA
jgi:hypothetical protein